MLITLQTEPWVHNNSIFFSSRGKGISRRTTMGDTVRKFFTTLLIKSIQLETEIVAGRLHMPWELCRIIIVYIHRSLIILRVYYICIYVFIDNHYIISYLILSQIVHRAREVYVPALGHRPIFQWRIKHGHHLILLVHLTCNTCPRTTCIVNNIQFVWFGHSRSVHNSRQLCNNSYTLLLCSTPRGRISNELHGTRRLQM